ncbi:PREDICTED: cardio acceleratory peptide 2b [Drosophila arizonae]|uniref:Cardio acceleratory peptide 2b n=1 Tax=Drosophila arizonae TaxID=7263 RepID=A0ABM1NLK4_DROAR|nr:PREDICTED: cardio acceleratory peptide 2b [Drosophila arizonae]XP_017855840.1 PREDICTED: cardio acceleratory peptide 2b [Drosophila arizonae]
MKSFLGLVNIAYTILLLVLLTKFTAAEVEHDKIRRGANMGLYAFPRVGRSDPSLVNSLHDASDAVTYENIYGMGDASAEDFEDYQKRPGLVAFPRMGRSESELRKWAHLLALQQALDKRTGPSASSGLWFGPRLGKRSINAKDYPAAGKGQKEMY